MSRLKLAALFYSVLIAAALLWGTMRGQNDIQLFFHPEGWPDDSSNWTNLLFGAAVGVGFGWLVARFSRFTVYRFRWAEQMHMEFRGILGPLDNLEVMAFSLFSAVGEEFFFRGALQSSTGIVISSLVFGALHIGPNRRFLPWPILAIVIGFALGFLFWVTGSLVAPVMAHFYINYRNLHFINRYDPSPRMNRAAADTIRR